MNVAFSFYVELRPGGSDHETQNPDPVPDGIR
jgi:hypothetical protein